DAVRELLPAIRAVLRGEQFLSASLAGHDLTEVSDERSTDSSQKRVATSPAQKTRIVRGHEAALYSDDGCLLDDATEFIGSALETGNPAVVVGIESHRDSLLARLQAHGLEMEAAIAQGRYIAVDAASTFSTFMTNGTPDLARYLKTFGDLILTAAKASR